MTSFTGFVDFHPVTQDYPLRRPRSLINAAKAGQAGWLRHRDLPRILRCHRSPGHDLALRHLQSEEQRLNGLRLIRAPAYDMQRHVLIMIALLAEMRAAAVNGPGTAIPERP